MDQFRVDARNYKMKSAIIEGVTAGVAGFAVAKYQDEDEYMKMALLSAGSTLVGNIVPPMFRMYGSGAKVLTGAGLYALGKRCCAEESSFVKDAATGFVISAAAHVTNRVIHGTLATAVASDGLNLSNYGISYHEGDSDSNGTLYDVPSAVNAP